MEGTFYLTIQAPANDWCADAIAIGDGVANGNSVFALTDTAIPLPTCGTNPGTDVWYTYLNPTGCSRQVKLSLCPADGGSASFDSLIRVYSGADCASLTEIACNDDFCGTQSRVTFTADPFATYRISVASDMNVPGGVFSLSVSHTSAMALQVAPGCNPAGGAGPVLSSNPPVLGGPLTFSITGAVPNSGGVLLYGPPLGGSSPLPGGCMFSLDPFTFAIFLIVSTNGTGSWSLGLGLPNDPTFECASVDLQALMFAGTGFQVTSCLRIVLGY
jgi:hypothetical protein